MFDFFQAAATAGTPSTALMHFTPVGAWRRHIFWFSLWVSHAFSPIPPLFFTMVGRCGEGLWPLDPVDFLYAVFMRGDPVPSRGFTRLSLIPPAKGGVAMGDAVAVLYGIFVFILLILYVQGCEKV